MTIRAGTLAFVVLAASVAAACSGASSGGAGASRDEQRLDERLAPGAAVPVREGLAAAILIDVSGSMNDAVQNDDGRREQKIAVARRAAQEVVEQFAKYADDHRDETVLLGLYEFSERSGVPDCRPIVQMAPPHRGRARQALEYMRAEGGTPIGNAMIAAKGELDATGLSRRHMVVVTDGENTDGVEPDRVAAAIGRRPESERPSIYFVAFDIDASRFSGVRDAGGLVLAATNARELSQTLDSLLRGKILVE